MPALAELGLGGDEAERPDLPWHQASVEKQAISFKSRPAPVPVVANVISIRKADENNRHKQHGTYVTLRLTAIAKTVILRNRWKYGPVADRRSNSLKPS